jgi:hypothetical protein
MRTAARARQQSCVQRTSERSPAGQAAREWFVPQRVPAAAALLARLVVRQRRPSLALHAARRHYRPRCYLHHSHLLPDNERDVGNDDETEHGQRDQVRDAVLPAVRLPTDGASSHATPTARLRSDHHCRSPSPGAAVLDFTPSWRRQLLMPDNLSFDCWCPVNCINRQWRVGFPVQVSMGISPNHFGDLVLAQWPL